MRPIRWSILLLLVIASRPVLVAQGVEIASSEHSSRIDVRDLRQETVVLPAHGREVPGLELDNIGKPRHIVGDDPAYAERGFVDTLWMLLRASRDTVLPGGVHWLRYHLRPDADLKGTSLMLNVSAKAATEVFLNGRSLARLPGSVRVRHRSDLPSSDSLLCVSVPFTFLCDGRPEVLAVRIAGAEGRSLRDNALMLSMLSANANYHMHRRMVHFGVFIGINLVILLLSLVIWRFDRLERSWLLLALLSVVSALDTFCEVGYDMGALGFGDLPLKVLGLVHAVLMPWPMFLLIMVLGRMRGDLSVRRAKWYTRGVWVVTFICAAFGIGELYGLLDGTEGLVILKDAPALIIVVIVLAVVFAAIVVWFAIDVVRLGIRLLRSTGYARWIGAGALASSLLTLVFRMMSGMSGLGLSSLLKVAADYCSYVAVPVSIAVYLAIRSGHHNRLVARQRDELDEEVKERTAQLSAEKDRSDELLLNILPAEVAEELKAKGHADAKHFDQATVLFTDFKGFTSMSERMPPAELLQELNSCFNAFDGIIAARGVEKIKTIGDAYMCVGGLPDPSTSTPLAVVHAALEMQAYMEQHKAEREAAGKPFFEMRVGIHSGPVVAGIVGVKKFQYDIWGDTVNTASRMESSGEVGQVNISGTTYALVKDEPGLSYTSRGKVQAKGKGEMEMYFALRSPEVST